MITLREVPEIGAMHGNVSVRAVAAAHSIKPPISVKGLIDQLAVKTFHSDVTTPSPESLGGTVDLTIGINGSYDLKVHMHDSGLPDYSFRLAILLRSNDGKILALYSNGTAHGTLSTGSRDFDDHQTGTDENLKDDWSAFAAGTLEVHRDFQDNLTSFLSTAFLDILGFVATTATLGGPAALVIWGGKALGSLTGVQLPANLGWAGLILAEGQMVLAGPTFFIPVFIAGVAATALAFKTRSLHADEIAEAKLVFGDTVPYDAVTVSNLSDSRGNAFAAPGPTGNFLIGGSSDFDNFLADDGSKHTLIHELTHVWQMANTSFKSFVSCDALSQLVGQQTLSSDRVYLKYYFYIPGQPWDDYNPEQQAQIVSDWWLATHYNDTSVSVTGPFGPQNEIYVDSVIRAVKP